MMFFNAGLRCVTFPNAQKAACTPVFQSAGCFLRRQSCANASIGLSLEAFLAGM